MILVDANLLLYAYMNADLRHTPARAWLNDVINGPAPVGLPWASLLAFLRISTNARAYAKPASVDRAFAQIEAWLALEVVWIPQPTSRHAEILGSLLRASGARGNLTTDAHLATLAIEHGLTVCSADADFARFPGLRWMNPLAA
ncbi:MAG: TA system VapC family ribonuclease toxin [Hyphomonadaceae bacterium]|nr:TA system VapC family ribonuclease toxin [Hyphomonadaceae bacterium]